MTAAELNLVIKAKDQSKKAFTAFRGRVSKTSVQIKRFTKYASDRFKALSRGLATFAKRGAIALAAFGAAAGYAFVKALRETIAFEMQMAKVSTMLDAKSRKLLPEFRKAITGISLEFGEATESLTDGAYDILSAMVAPSEAMKVLKTGTQAAIAGFTDTKTAISVLLTAMKAYGIKTSKITDISDKFLTVQERGRTTLAEMAPVFGRLAAMAASAGGSFDETAAAMATVTRAGLPTVLAITGLSAAYRTFLISSDESKEAAKRAGFELTQQWLKTHSLREALEMIHKTRQVELKDVFATSEAILAAGLLMKNLGGFTKDTTAITKDFADATKRSADKMKSQLGFQLKRLRIGFVELGKAMTSKFGEKLKPLIEEANRTMPRLIKLFGEIGDVLADKIGPYMEKFVAYLRSVTKEKLAEQYEKIKEAFQKMVPFVKAIAYGMGIIAVATNAWLLALLEIKGLLEIGSKLYNFIALQQSKVLLGQAKEARALAESYKAQAAEAETLEEKNRLMKEYYRWMKKSTQMSEQAARNAQKVIDKGVPTVSITDMFKGEPVFPGLAEAKEKFDKILEPMKTGLETTNKQANKEKSINSLLENRRQILENLQKARAKIPRESFRSTAESGEELVVTEKGKVVSAEQFDRTVAEAKAQNQALDSLKTATETMLGDLIQNYKDGKIGIDELAKGIANYSSQASSLSSAQTNALSQVISIVKNLISKTNSLAKTVNNQSRRIKQLAGQGA